MNTNQHNHRGGHQRRGFFRRAGMFAAVAAAAAALGGAALHAHAHGGPGFRGAMFGGPANADPAKQEERIERMLKHLFAAINATPEQQQKLTPIVRQAARDLQPLRAQMHTVRQQAAQLMSAETIDRAAIENLRSEQLKAAEAVSRRMTQALADAAEVLTPEQRKQLAERMQRRHGQGGEGRGMGGPGMGGHGMHHRG